MKIRLLMVSSLDGRISHPRLGAPALWSSPEDQKHFYKLIKKAPLIIMGSRTFTSARKYIHLTPDNLRIVLSRKKEKYAKEAVAGQLEFSSKTPVTLIKELAKRGYKEALLVGGAETNASFFKAKLIDEILLTIEPVIFGSGKTLTEKIPHNIQLKLLSLKKINARGTLLLHYAIL